MSISTKQLTKAYGSQKAIDAISFDIPKGQIIGFLGPNGAGKSTTMKILTGYIQATEGEAFINGFDVSKEPIAVKNSIGYLPEHNPLYLEMYVKEFLEFAGSLHGLRGKTLKNRVAEVIELVGLDREQHKKIEQLSKGYRQRVGLAQALIHEPEVLILDEPTTGLDPNQLVEIRNLIKEAGKNKTVILSTHIMQEVESICERAIIINRGKIVADQSLAELKASGQSMEEVFRSLTGN
ncbi:ATP-binding cassette domain-containing protein [Jiulongibacter sediminis]|uniref:Multidrug ABC transporter ATPase n=1 Tax=Jiulongibacter sediminis TaxID=1605367 RepID=A0A0P7C4T3_9BACT|nr:ATP-binding cassette domain-containing protein [Jiulongibacter sediminis]KPM48272.1 multidrug ABC transporter ATPase [Jiulongibacter sediminis]TBX24813.1 multidrug ABC transporter ATPase [Jiulongibacter sediminis]